MPTREIRHPLIRHKLGLMRRADISTKNFRELAQEVGALLTYEATQDLPLETYEIDGWCGKVQVEKNRRQEDYRSTHPARGYRHA